MSTELKTWFLLSYITPIANVCLSPSIIEKFRNYISMGDANEKMIIPYVFNYHKPSPPGAWKTNIKQQF